MTAVAIEEMRLTCVRETSVLNVHHQYSHSNSRNCGPRTDLVVRQEVVPADDLNVRVLGRLRRLVRQDALRRVEEARLLQRRAEQGVHLTFAGVTTRSL